MTEKENEICKLTGEPCIRANQKGWGYCGGNRDFKGICPEVLNAVEGLQSKLEGEGRHLEPRVKDSNTVLVYHRTDEEGKENGYLYRTILKGALVRYQI